MNALKLSNLLMMSAMALQPVLAQEATNAAPAQPRPALNAPAQPNAPEAAKPAPPPSEGPARKENGGTPNAAPATAATNLATPNASSLSMTNAAGEKLLRLNFHGAPLSMVLTYLSDAAGLIIVLETEVNGKVDVWSQQPLTVDEAVNLLNSILNKNGYAAIRNGRTLTIVSRADAKTRDIPVKIGSNPAEIPKNDEMVTQIVPVRYANAVQMVKDLQPLLPTYASLTANESGNALVLTDVQSDIRRMVEIVKALDTSISSISTVRVFPLRFADSKELAAEVKELFPTQNATGNNAANNAMPMFPGFGRNRQGNNQAASTSEARTAAGRVTAVADERTNSLVVSAPEDAMPVIEQLVKEIDTSAENITELRVFRLKYADPVEMADELSSLFPDESKTDTTRSSFQFGRGGFMGGAAQNGSSSSRAKQMSRVVAVPDQRTSSVIITAAADLMPQIAQMIEQLDSNPAKKQKVYVYSLENADVDNVTSVLQDMFQSSNSRGSSSSSRQTSNALTTRQTQSSQSTSTSGNSRSSRGGNGN